MTIKETDRAFNRQLNRNLVSEEITRLFRDKRRSENLTQKELAAMIDMDPGQLSKILKEPSNLQLDTISDLLLAMDSEMSFQAVERHSEQSLEDFMTEFVGFASNQRIKNLSSTYEMSSPASSVVIAFDQTGSEDFTAGSLPTRPLRSIQMDTSLTHTTDNHASTAAN